MHITEKDGLDPTDPTLYLFVDIPGDLNPTSMKKNVHRSHISTTNVWKTFLRIGWFLVLQYLSFYPLGK